MVWYLWNLVHWCVACPLVGLFGSYEPDWLVRFYDWSGELAGAFGGIDRDGDL
jgi:hypothetical protein